ncbi:MAG: hypothetical protein JW940_32550 [Polyangiaceae bacterium]|nr:hypothetical protein [Polyangiaceae bacterium]
MGFSTGSVGNQAQRVGPGAHVLLAVCTLMRGLGQRLGLVFQGDVLAAFALAAVACTTVDHGPCGAGQTDCNGTCVWLTHDGANCGACSAACSTGHTCRAGQCVCPEDQQECDGRCVDVLNNAEHCGECSAACSIGQSCDDGKCVCDFGLSACGDRCVDTQSDPEHCGRCGAACARNKFCSEGKCAEYCAPGLTACGRACVELDRSADHCGQCDNACPAGHSCENGTCACGAGLYACGADCVDLSSNSSHCGTCNRTCSGGEECRAGSCVCPQGQISCEGQCIVGDVCSSALCEPACEGGQVCVDRACQCPSGQQLCAGQCVLEGTCASACAKSSGMLSDFENVSLALSSSTEDHWTGVWYRLGDATESSQTLAVEPFGSYPCHQFALHTTGEGLRQPVGIGFNLKGTPDAPEPYDAGRWAGIRFRARLGDAATKPTRLNIVTPWTRDDPCGDETDSVSDCGNHLGRFLRGDNAVTTEWRELVFCFDRDLYPLEVPSALTNDQRRQAASNVLEIQFQFNRDKQVPQVPSAGTTYPQDPAGARFDFWVDDIEFVQDPGLCPAADFESTPGTAQPYPMNARLGRCQPVSDATKFEAAIAQSYVRWRDRFVVWDPHGCSLAQAEQGLSNSQAVAYAMLATAAMGDQAFFNCLWAYAKNQGAADWLMISEPHGVGSTTEADEDMAEALLVAEEQWHDGHGASATALIASMLASDVLNDALLPGSEWEQSGAFAPAAFAPSLYRVFERVSGDEAWARVLANGYETVRANAQSFGRTQLVTDLCDSSGSPTQHSDYGLDRTFGFTEPAYGFDAARVPMRLSWDACLEGSSDAEELLAGILSFFEAVSEGGASIERLRAGWYASGEPAPMALANQMSFIGPIGAGAMAFDERRALSDRVFRVVLDLIECPEFNRDYYQATIGLITLLQMSGNLPHST